MVIAAAAAAAVKKLIENSLGGLSYATVLASAASVAVLALGFIAALDQLHIAANVVNAIMCAVLVALLGVVIVAVGGGGIKTMSQRWETVAARYDAEKPRMQQQVRSAPSVADQERDAKAQAHAAHDGGSHRS